MKRKKGEHQRVLVRIQFRKERGYFHPALYPVLMERGAAYPHNVPYDELVNGLFLRNIECTAQGNDDDRSHGVYAYAVHYDQMSYIDRRAAERMAATLRTVEKRLQQANERDGSPLTFGQWALRAARAIGAVGFVIAEEEPVSSAMYEDSRWTTLSLASGQAEIDARISKWMANEPFPLYSLR